MRIPLLFCFIIAFASNLLATQVDTISIKSAAMNKMIRNVVIKPSDYVAKGQEYPVLYLLHGATGNYSSWITKVGALKTYANQYNIIIVCPDGGYTSWYFDSPIDENMQYETYIADELIKVIDQQYNTLTNKNGRAITGLSMGGHGALYLAFKHQNLWGAAGSMSGGVDIRPFPANWDIPKRLGVYAENKAIWEANSVINMIYLLKHDSLKLIIDCGYDDFFLNVNRKFHQKLLDRNIEHDYIERSGAHNWNYWANSIKYQMQFFSDFFGAN